MEQLINRTFAAQFGGEGTLYASSGRINLIGEHTDYNEGYVLPGAIDLGIMLSIRPNDEDVVRAYAANLEEEAQFQIGDETLPEKGWMRYIYGVCCEVQKRGGTVKGFDAVFAGDLPLGAGLSSSAALESVFAFAINELFNDSKFQRFELARIGQSTEHNYCGVKCGIMDQFASLHGRAGHLVRLDCRSLEYDYFPFQSDDYQLVLINSCVKHQLTDSPYNRRRESCERVAAALGLPSLRGAKMEDVIALKGQLSDEDIRRAVYIVDEERRVPAVCEALQNNDFERVGELMYEAHKGQSEDFEISCEEIDFLHSIARECGVTGSRMMGGGFGGCTINLVLRERYNDFISTSLARYKDKYGIDAEVIDVKICDGSHRVE